MIHSWPFANYLSIRTLGRIIQHGKNEETNLFFHTPRTAYGCGGSLLATATRWLASFISTEYHRISAYMFVLCIYFFLMKISTNL